MWWQNRIIAFFPKAVSWLHRITKTPQSSWAPPVWNPSDQHGSISTNRQKNVHADDSTDGKGNGWHFFFCWIESWRIMRVSNIGVVVGLMCVTIHLSSLEPCPGMLQLMQRSESALKNVSHLLYKCRPKGYRLADKYPGKDLFTRTKWL